MKLKTSMTNFDKQIPSRHSCDRLWCCVRVTVPDSVPARGYMASQAGARQVFCECAFSLCVMVQPCSRTKKFSEGVSNAHLGVACY